MFRTSHLNSLCRSHLVLSAARASSASFSSSIHENCFHGTALASFSNARFRRDPPKRPKSSNLQQHQRCFCTFVSKHFSMWPGEIESFLRRHSIIYRGSDTQLIIEECPFCPPTKRKRDNLYALKIKRTTGGFKCHRCKKTGNWYSLKKTYSSGMIGPIIPDTEERPAREDSTTHETVIQEKRVETKPAPSRESQESFLRNLWNTKDSVAKSYLNQKRCLKDDVLRKYGIGCGNFDIFAGRDSRPKELCLTFPMYDGNGQLVRHKIRPVESKSGMRLWPKGGNWGFFGLNTVPADAKSVVLTEGEFDAMSVYQSTGRPAISIPNGASSLPVELLPHLERFDHIYLWMDEDEPGQTGADSFSRKLGLRRCRSVRGLNVEGKPCKDANEGLQRGIHLEALIQKAEVIQHSGLVTFDDIRDQVLADLNNIRDPTVVRSQSIPRLHELMKGLRPGELTILSGPTGCGKTTLLSQLSLDYCVQNVPTLWGSFEMENARLAGKLLWQYHAVYNKEKKNLVDNFDFWADRFAELPFFFMRYHGSNPVEQVIETMDYAHYLYDCRHVVLDNLQFMSYGQSMGHQQRQFEVLDHAVSQVREFSTKRKVHVTLVVHPRKTDDDNKLQIASVYGSAKATQEADNVLILQTTNAGRVLEVKKNRFDGALGGIFLKFDKKRLMFSQGDSSGSWLGWKSDIKGYEDRKKVEKLVDGVKKEIKNGDLDKDEREEQGLEEPYAMWTAVSEDITGNLLERREESIQAEKEANASVLSRDKQEEQGIAERDLLRTATSESFAATPLERQVESMRVQKSFKEDVLERVVPEESVLRKHEDELRRVSKSLEREENGKDTATNVRNSKESFKFRFKKYKLAVKNRIKKKKKKKQLDGREERGSGWEGMGTGSDEKVFSSSS